MTLLTNPIWINAVVGVINALTLMAIFWFHTRKINKLDFENKNKNTYDDVKRHILAQQNALNKMFLDYEVESPYAYHLKMGKNRESSLKCAAVLSHINILQSVYEHKEILGVKEVDLHKRWAVQIVGPWLISDADRYNIYKFIRKTEEATSSGFFVWLDPMMPHAHS